MSVTLSKKNVPRESIPGMTWDNAQAMVLNNHFKYITNLNK